MTTVIASSTTSTPADVVASIVLEKQVGGAYPVADTQWADLAKFFNFDPKKIDAFSPLKGPYAGKSFVKQSQVVQPGAPAVKAAAGTVAASAANSLVPGIWSALTNPSNWLRGLEILGAVIAIYMGLRSLTGAPGIIETAEKVKP